METYIKLFSNENGSISNFLSKLFNLTIEEKNFLNSKLEWQKKYANPIEMADIIGVFIDNKEDYNINMWVSLDSDVLINVTDNNVNDIIKYLYERFPY